MSPDHPVMINIPFGYAWTEAEEGETASSQPPSGPPLLDNAESSILRNFFDDPNNVDPQFLALGQQNLPDQNNGLSDFPPFNWETPTNMPAPDIKPQPFNAASLNQPSHTFNAFTQPIPKDEDLFAANILQTGLNPPVNGQSAQLAQQGFMQPLQQKSPTSMPPPSSNFANSQMGFPSNTYPTQNGQYARPAAAVQAGPAGPASAQRSLEPLNFGSDAGFRNHYAGSASFEAPDRELKSIVTEHFQHYGGTAPPLGKHATSTDTSGDTTPQTPANKGKKRESEFAIDDEGSSDEEDPSRPNKRRRNRVKEEQAEEDEEGQSSRKSKKQSKKAAPSSPGKRRKSSPGASKIVRENLSEAQKRSNHIQSEQKRRNLIKQGFEDLTRMVPELRPGGLSKSNMLVEAAKFIREIRDNNEKLKQKLDAG